MEFVKLEAWPRTAGKTENIQLRRDGKIPAVSYGLGLASRSLALAPKDLVAAIGGPHGINVVLQVAVGDEKPFPALVHDYTCHPVTRQVNHVDLLHIDLDKPVDVEVPMTCTGKAIGVVEGGVLRQVFRTLPIRCLPALIPSLIEHDVTELRQGDTVKATGIKLPDGVSIRLAPEQTVIAIVAPEAEKPEEGAAAAVAEGAAAAPEAGAATAGAVAAPGAAPAAAKAAPAEKEKKAKK